MPWFDRTGDTRGNGPKAGLDGGDVKQQTCSWTCHLLQRGFVRTNELPRGIPQYLFDMDLSLSLVSFVPQVYTLNISANLFLVPLAALTLHTASKLVLELEGPNIIQGNHPAKLCDLGTLRGTFLDVLESRRYGLPPCQCHQAGLDHSAHHWHCH